jgi:hypothetical protein
MDISSLSTLLGLILATCGITTFLYKVWRALTTKLRANKARIDDLEEGVKGHDEILDEIIYHLSLPEESKIPFNNRAALKNLRRRATENHDSRNTSGFN